MKTLIEEGERLAYALNVVLDNCASMDARVEFLQLQGFRRDEIEDALALVNMALVQAHMPGWAERAN